MKTFAKRDSATALLRKMGIAKTDYNNFITKKGEEFVVNVKAAEASLLPVAPTPAEKPVAKAAKKPAVTKEKKADKPKVKLTRVTETPTPSEGKGQFIKRLISLGYTNAEIWADIVVRYELDDKKKYYPGWYRYDMRRQGFEV